MATGTVKVDESIDLYVLEPDCVLDFRLMPGSDRPLISVGRICRERGFGCNWPPEAESAEFRYPDGELVDTFLSQSCIYVSFNSPRGSAAPFTRGGGSASGSGDPPADVRTDGPDGSEGVVLGSAGDAPAAGGEVLPPPDAPHVPPPPPMLRRGRRRARRNERSVERRVAPIS